MRILFAVPDRDLLECYKKLLEDDFGETVTAFDGTQALTLLGRESFDIALLDRGLPRSEPKAVIKRLREKGVPVIVLTEGSVSAALLTEEALPNAYLSYPFGIRELSGAVADLLEKARSDERISLGDAVIEVSRFEIDGGSALTAGEIDVIKAVTEGRSVTTAEGAYISAVNAKLALCGSKTRIAYRTEKGFIPVRYDE